MAKRGENRYIKLTGNGDNEYNGQIIQTIISEGDAIGAVIILDKDGSRALGEAELKAAIIAATFLGKQMEG